MGVAARYDWTATPYLDGSRPAMKRTPWAFVVLNFIAGALLGVLTWWSRVPTVAALPAFIQPLASLIYPNVLGWIVGISLFSLAVNSAEKLVSMYGVRKKTVQRILNQVVKTHLDNDPRNNRCTLFKASAGWRVFLHGLARLPWQESKGVVLRDIVRLLRDPFGVYLYVYVRAAKSLNDRSCSFWKVYHHKRDGCHGVAGEVWVKGYHTQSQKQRFKPGDVATTLRGARNLSDVAKATKVRQYAEQTHVDNIHQLRARNQMALHFVGSVIESRDAGNRWGVLLVDSTLDTPPFPLEEEDEEGFKEDFESYAHILSTLLT